jgi:hypothetical protein
LGVALAEARLGSIPFPYYLHTLSPTELTLHVDGEGGSSIRVLGPPRACACACARVIRRKGERDVVNVDEWGGVANRTQY